MEMGTMLAIKLNSLISGGIKIPQLLVSIYESSKKKFSSTIQLSANVKFVYKTLRFKYIKY